MVPVNLSPSRLLTITRKEFDHIFRDPRLLFLVITAPAFLLITFSYVFSMDVDRVDIAVRDLDRTSLSRDLLDAITAGDDFVVVSRVDRQAEIEQLFARGMADLVLVIPRGFAEAVTGGGSAQVQCIADGADAITANQAIALLGSRVEAFVADLRPGAAGGGLDILDIRDRAWYNETMDSMVSMVPGMMPIILCMPSLALTLALAREKETGSLESLVATPVRGTEYLLGKLLAYGVGGLMSAALAWLVATVWFRVPFRGSLMTYFLLTADYLFGTLAISIVMAHLARSQQTAMFLILMIFFVPGFFISGLIMPVSNEPVARAIAHLLPATHFMTISRAVFLKGLRAAALWRPALALFGMGAIAFTISLVQFEKKIA